MDAVAIIVEGRFIEQRGTDHVCGVNHGAVGRVTENVGNCWHVVAAPLRGSVGLRNLLRDPVTKHGEFRSELMVNPGNLFAQSRGRIIASNKIHATVRRREYSAVLATRSEQ